MAKIQTPAPETGTLHDVIIGSAKVVLELIDMGIPPAEAWDIYKWQLSMFMSYGQTAGNTGELNGERIGGDTSTPADSGDNSPTV